MLEWSFDTRDASAARRTRLEFVRYVDSFFDGQADAGAAELVLGELIGNVVRYAPGPARVKADCDDAGITIAVRDYGPGFAPPNVDAEISLFSESGRGLAIVTSLAQTLEIESPDTDGCCVRARLEVRANEDGLRAGGD